MAGDKEDPNPSAQCQSSWNPFITFKRFVDVQVDALSNITFSRYHRHIKEMKLAAEELRQERQEKHTRWTGRTESPDYDNMLMQRLTKQDCDNAYDLALLVLDGAYRANASVDPAKIGALYADDHPMHLFAAEGPRQGPRWLTVDWFKHSAYSPIAVEADHPTSQPGQWRSAFEDLIMSSLGRTMDALDCPSKRKHALVPGLEWTVTLQSRGILPPLLPSLYTNNAPHGQSDYPSFRKHAEIWRNQWHQSYPSMTPPTAWTEVSDLAREFAHPLPRHSPSEHELAAAMNTSYPKTDHNISSQVKVGSTPHPHSGSSATDRHDQDDQLNLACASFWTSITTEDTDNAARIIKQWEKQGKNVFDLIISDSIVDAYLATDTPPSLWPLCEALEKADSRLYREQFRRRSRGQYRRLPEESASMSVSPPTPTRDNESSQTLPTRQTQSPSHHEPEQQLERPSSTVNNQDRPIQAQHNQQQSVSPDVSSFSTGKPMVLAAMTTIHTTVLPDGTVTKKTVLKKRFADGKEETTESVQVEHADQEVKENGDNDQLHKKKGWFWSW